MGAQVGRSSHLGWCKLSAVRFSRRHFLPNWIPASSPGFLLSPALPSALNPPFPTLANTTQPGCNPYPNSVPPPLSAPSTPPASGYDPGNFHLSIPITSSPDPESSSRATSNTPPAATAAEYPPSCNLIRSAPAARTSPHPSISAPPHPPTW